MSARHGSLWRSPPGADAFSDRVMAGLARESVPTPTRAFLSAIRARSPHDAVSALWTAWHLGTVRGWRIGPRVRVRSIALVLSVVAVLGMGGSLAAAAAVHVIEQVSANEPDRLGEGQSGSDKQGGSEDLDEGQSGSDEPGSLDDGQSGADEPRGSENMDEGQSSDEQDGSENVEAGQSGSDKQGGSEDLDEGQSGSDEPESVDNGQSSSDEQDDSENVDDGQSGSDEPEGADNGQSSSDEQGGSENLDDGQSGG